MGDIPARFQLRKGTAALWASVNPILADGEPGLETDTGRLRMGNGVAQFTALPYYAQYADLDPDLTAFGGLTTTGLVARTGAGTAATRTLESGGPNITITHGDGVDGDPVISLTPGPLTQIGGLTPVQGDLLVRDATVMARLPKGAAGQVLQVNAGGTMPAWQSVVPANFRGLNPTSFSGNGWTELPGGLILQWGVFNHGGGAGSDHYQPLPRAFPNANVAAFVSALAQQQMGSWPSGLDHVRIQKGNSDSGFRSGYFFAIGW